MRRHAAALGLPAGFGVLDAGDAADLLDLVREEHGHGAARAALPAQGDAARHLLAHGQRPAAAVASVLAEAFPWCERARARRLARLFGDYGARKRALGVLDLDDLLLYWRALAARRGDRAAARGAVRPRAGRRVPGRQRPAGRPRARRCARSGADVTAVGDDFQAIYGFRSASRRAHPRLPRALPRRRGGHARAQLPLDAAAARRRQRRRGAGASGLPASACAPSARAARAPELVFCRDEAAQAVEVCDRVLAARERGHGAARAGGARCARRTTPTCSSSSSRAGASRSSSTAGCATSRPRTSRTSSRCCAWPTTRADELALVPRAAAARGRRAGDGARRALDALGPRRRRTARRARALAAGRAGAAPAAARGPAPTRWSRRCAPPRDEPRGRPARRAAARRARAARRGALPRRRRCACRTSTSSSAAARQAPRPRATSSPSWCSTRRSRARDLARPPHLDED